MKSITSPWGPSTPEHADLRNRTEEILDRYARDLYESYCVGFV